MRTVEKSDHSFYCYIDGERVAIFYGTDAGAETDAMLWVRAPETAAEVKRLTAAVKDLQEDNAFLRKQLAIAQERAEDALGVARVMVKGVEK